MAVSICGNVSPFATSKPSSDRSCAASGASATLSGSWQTTHMKSGSMPVSDRRGFGAAAAGAALAGAAIANVSANAIAAIRRAEPGRARVEKVTSAEPAAARACF